MRRNLFLLPLIGLALIFLAGCPKPEVYYSISGTIRPYSGESEFVIQRAEGFVPVVAPEDIARGYTGEFVVIFERGYDSLVLGASAEILDEFASRDGSLSFSVVRTENPELLKKIEGVRSIESNRVFTLQTEPLFPDDPLYGDQWGYPMIEMPLAWNIVKGSPTVVVAVVDSGARLDHPDLQGIFLPGYDFTENDSDPTDNPRSGKQSHGTHVTGTIAAVTDNSLGVAGMTWGQFPSIIPVKVFDNNGSTTESIIAQGIVYAVEHGARIINMSFAGPDTPVVKAAINYAFEHGVLMIAAAGNYNTSNPYYPASYEEVISVSAVGPTMLKASYSNYGNGIDFAAPGGDSKVGGEAGTIKSTGYTASLGNSYTYLAGTSMASPHVAGLAALLMAKGYAGRDEFGEEIIKKILRETALDLGEPGWDEYYGYGLVQAYAALFNAPSIAERRPFVIQALSPGGTVLASAEVREDGSFSLEGLTANHIKLRVWRDVNGSGQVDKGDLLGFAGLNDWTPSFEEAALLSFFSSGEKELSDPIHFSPVIE